MRGDRRGVRRQQRRRGERGVGVGDRPRGTEAAGRPVDRRRRGDDAFPPSHRRTRVVTAEPGDRAVDEARVRGPHRVVSEPEPIHDAGPEVLDEHVGVTHEVESGLDPRSRLQIELHAALAPLEHRVRRVVPPRSAGRIDVNDFSTCVSEQHREQRPGDVVTEVDDLQPVERALPLPSLLLPFCTRSSASSATAPAEVSRTGFTSISMISG